MEKGYNKIDGLDYFDTYYLGAKITSIRLIIALTLNYWLLHQLDVNNTFLHEGLYEDVYMTIPPGFIPSNPNKVCKIFKSMMVLNYEVGNAMKSSHSCT